MIKLLLQAFFMLIAGLAFPQTGEKNFIDQNYIEVTGTAEMEIVPDMIYLNIIVNESDTKGKIPLETLELKMKQRLAENGVDVGKDLTVSDLSSGYKKYFLKDKDVVSKRSYVLLVHDAATAGKVIEALGEEEISNISILKTDHSQMAQKRFDIRLDAIKAAKRKAEAMAGALGQTIGKAIYITETSNDNYLQSNTISQIRGSRTSDNSIFINGFPDLSFENFTIKSSVLVRFILN